ncbi:DUF4184 family protein [Streptomyces sp. AC495_CC817]|uniref:DUF4184 family protein n=1 Tax=Streptomyces sp. AC495_CC817 TaxID=2823900 RepID=UPI001C27DE4B|nr:DUF4184 family protein [Streptomyces sp. AC495_CC817]
MPFTPSHALVALPFIRTPLVPAAIAIGAMTPDLPLFVRGLGIDYGFLHSNANIVWTALLAFALFLVWRVVLRPAVPELAPESIARRLPVDWRDTGMTAVQRAMGIGAGRWYPVLLAVSLLLGVASHILWDSFTHEGRSGVSAFPLLDAHWGPLPGYKWLQYGSGVIGLVVIGIWALLRLVKAQPRSTVEHVLPTAVRVAWWLSLPVILVVAWGLGVVVFGPFTSDFTVQHLAYRVLPPACAVWGVLTLALCLLLPLIRRRHQRG